VGDSKTGAHRKNIRVNFCWHILILRLASKTPVPAKFCRRAPEIPIIHPIHPALGCPGLRGQNRKTTTTDYQTIEKFSPLEGIFTPKGQKSHSEV
jgi:hypothetical protein